MQRELPDVAEMIERQAHESAAGPRISPQSPTWQAVKQWIQEQIDMDLQPTLRNRTIDHSLTQYARGGYDYLDRLLEYGEQRS